MILNHERQEFTLAPLENDLVVLRPVTPDDYGIIQRAELSDALIQRWRYRGSTPSPEQWAGTLWNGTLAQFIVVAKSRNEPVGLVVVYRPMFQHGYAYFGAVRFGETDLSPVMLSGIVLFLVFAFRTWNLRKLYMEIPEYNVAQFESAIDRFMSIEGRLRDHSYYDGHYWDELFVAIYRDAVETEAATVASVLERRRTLMSDPGQ